MKSYSRSENQISTLSYTSVLFVAELTSLESRIRDQLTRSFFHKGSVSLPFCLYMTGLHLSCLGSDQPHGSHVLLHVPKHCSFINFALNHYQTVALDEQARPLFSTQCFVLYYRLIVCVICCYLVDRSSSFY